MNWHKRMSRFNFNCLEIEQMLGSSVMYTRYVDCRDLSTKAIVLQVIIIDHPFRKKNKTKKQKKNSNLSKC
jgi:hypothetical protein